MLIIFVQRTVILENGRTRRQIQTTLRGKTKTETRVQFHENIYKRIPTGKHEVEIYIEGSLQNNFQNCKKNPGHVNFIPVNYFNLEHLPSRYHDDIMLEVIKALSALTVLVKVKYTSLERPFAPCLGVQYSCYNERQKDIRRSGTGLVYCVVKYTESDNKGTCPCGKCQHSDRPSNVWGEVGVLTAAHVVFDDSEARQTRCVVGFDDNISPEISLDGWKVVWADIKGDRCEFSCVSCDLKLVDELDKICRRFDDISKQAEKKYGKFDDIDRLTIIVSHPHGQPKKVSVGKWFDNTVRDMYWTKYTYDTATCPGSSGAPIYTLRDDNLFHVHSGCLPGPVNFSVEDCVQRRQVLPTVSK